MNKYFKIVISVVLIIISLIVIVKNNSVYYGRGIGVGEKIQNFDELNLMINDLFHKEDNKENLTTSEKENQKKYTSATFTLYTKLSTMTTYDSSFDGGSMERTMVVYHTETEAYYIIDAKMITNLEGERSTVNISADYYFDFVNEKSLFKIKDFNFNSTEEISLDITKYLIGRWVDYKDLSDLLLSVADDNSSTLKILGEAINNITSDEYIEIFNEYYISTKKTAEIIADLLGGDSADKDFVEALGNSSTISYNLQNKKKPIINIHFLYQDDNNSLSEKLKIEFSNINNTVVKFPGDIDIIDDEKLDKILDGLADDE